MCVYSFVWHPESKRLSCCRKGPVLPAWHSNSHEAIVAECEVARALSKALPAAGFRGVCGVERQGGLGRGEGDWRSGKETEHVLYFRVPPEVGWCVYLHMYVWAPTEARKGARSPSELESQAVLTSLV